MRGVCPVFLSLRGRCILDGLFQIIQGNDEVLLFFRRHSLHVQELLDVPNSQQFVVVLLSLPKIKSLYITRYFLDVKSWKFAH